MTKADIVARVVNQTGMTQKDAYAAVERLFETVKMSLERGEMVKISGFGNFVVKEKADRRGRTPQTGEKITIAARKVLTFKPSEVLRQAVNVGPQAVSSQPQI